MRGGYSRRVNLPSDSLIAFQSLRLPLFISISTASLRSAIDTSWCLARSLTPAANSGLVCQLVVLRIYNPGVCPTSSSAMAPARQRITDGQAGRHYYPRAAFESEGAFRKDFGRAGAWAGCARRERVRKDFRFHWERNHQISEISAGFAVQAFVPLHRGRLRRPLAPSSPASPSLCLRT
jgi:hypothetical protein